MQSWTRLALIVGALPILLAAEQAHAQDSETVTACETLISARRIDAAAGAERQALGETGCRRIPRSAIGAVEQRALIGGAPYECMSVADAGRCLWVVP
ncbi:MULTISPECIES: hypothetical protein [Methylobacterium]|jgi:hypothetical protein|uniref:Protein of unassigned function n=1 Tax=Methylobacterium oryzae CBMB20 TaxID=693986 RepID=A0A089NL17_9HYPH|nr:MULTISPECIES: hypothetical protein [Methylobacterium]AIQ88571.1 protein of unassigned function [Methylobacterium oryzae CBMB20]AWV18856.1 hypothetical protein A3862_27670 [Methylobacterium sp. XJLW]MDH3029309.1 hypothetical protein [Methylobacterium fujisawaense]WFS08595.1 hypothetical protein P9K36_04660 [Methylobacterium sp. 391_Methyba4]